MNDPGFPGRHTTTTSVQQTTVQPEMRLDASYIRTVPGILKCAVMALNLLGFICIQVSGLHRYASRGEFFSTTAMTGFWFTAILLVFYLFHICEKFYKIPWLKIELIYCAIWVILYLFAASFAAAYPVEAYSAAAFFGFCAMCLYGYDAFLKFRTVKAGGIAQGARSVHQQTTVTTA